MQPTPQTPFKPPQNPRGRPGWVLPLLPAAAARRPPPGAAPARLPGNNRRLVRRPGPLPGARARRGRRWRGRPAPRPPPPLSLGPEGAAAAAELWGGGGGVEGGGTHTAGSAAEPLPRVTAAWRSWHGHGEAPRSPPPHAVSPSFSARFGPGVRPGTGKGGPGAARRACAGKQWAYCGVEGRRRLLPREGARPTGCVK